jgi:hypothetical protein
MLTLRLSISHLQAVHKKIGREYKINTVNRGQDLNIITDNGIKYENQTTQLHEKICNIII